MDKESVEKDVIDIDILDPVDNDNVVAIKDETRAAENYGTSSIPDVKSLKTGNIIAQLFNIFADLRDKTFWKLNDTEINSLNNTCPKILPKIVQEHSGIIGCVLSLLSIIVKRIKLEQQDTDEPLQSNATSSSEKESSQDSLSLTGERNV